MIISYDQTKDKVLKRYDDFLEIVRQSGFPREDCLFTALEKQVAKIKSGKFCLMIAGEAKSGKSTFINAYLGTEILPMDVKTCTSSIIEIRYGAKFMLHATFSDGKKRQYTGEQEIKDFLKENAALDDAYRDIPIVTINNELIVAFKGERIPEGAIRNFLEWVKDENTHNLPQEEYEQKIRKYIQEKGPEWAKIVMKIDIEYPFESESMRGIRIIDSPGVNAGKEGDVTESYIESADAIMFLKPITGAAPNAKSFKKFLESKSVDKNKNVVFLVLTHTSSESQTTINEALDQYVKIFGVQQTGIRHGIAEEQIIPVDSKAKLYYNYFYHFSTEKIKARMKELNVEQKADPFLKLAWFEADGDKNDFLDSLRKLSNFDSIEQALNQFGRKAQFLVLDEFLERMLKAYTKIEVGLKDLIANYELKSEDPAKLVDKIEKTKNALTDIENKMNETVDGIVKKYASADSDGIIVKNANAVMDAYRDEIEKIDGKDDSGLDQLEKLSFRQIDKFMEFEKELQQAVVSECDKALKVLNDRNAIPNVTLEPDFSEEVIEKIKDSVREESTEAYTYTTGTCHKKLHKGQRFSQQKFFDLVKNDIVGRIDVIKQQAIRDLRSFVSHTVTIYTKELAHNADLKKDELNRINNDKKTAVQIAAMLEFLRKTHNTLISQKTEIERLKGGIDGNV